MAIRTDWQHDIGGKWVDAVRGRRISLEDPATGKPIAQIARAEAADVEASKS